MSTESVSLPIVAGGPGAGISVLELSPCKNIVVAGLSGTVNVQAKVGGADWCTVASFSGSVLDKVVEVVADQFRVDATNGSVSSVEVVAERGSNRTGDIPVPPSSGPGADLDVAQFGERTTFQLTGKSGSGSVNIEASGDGINYSVITSFQADGCKTVDCTSAKFVRAVGNGASAVAIGIGSADPAISGITAPRTKFVFRPNAPGEVTGNEYKDWATLVAATQEVSGMKEIWFVTDDTALGSVPLGGDPFDYNIEIPAGDWDMRDVTWVFPQLSSNERNSSISILLRDGCKLNKLRRFHSLGGPTVVISESSDYVFDDFEPGLQPFYQVGSSNLLAVADGASPMIFIDDGTNLGWTTEGCASGFGSPFAGPGGNNPVIEIGANGALICFAFDGGTLISGTLSGTGTVLPATNWVGVAIGINSFYGNGRETWSTDHPAFTGVFFEAYDDSKAQHYQVSNPDGLLFGLEQTYGAFIQADTSLGAVAKTLPPAALHPGAVYAVKDIGANASVNNITVSPTGADTIEGAAAPDTINSDGAFQQYVSDGVAGWWKTNV